MNKAVIGGIVVVLALVLGIVLFSGSNDKQVSTGNAIAINNDGSVTVKLTSTSGGQYEPAQIRVKTGTKVIIEGDSKTLTGGMDTVIIDGYNIRKLISENDNKIEFIANKAGEFDVYCANGMGNGKLIVSD